MSIVSSESSLHLVYLALPPAPPRDFTPGEFEYVKTMSTRIMLKNAYQAITQTETWGFINQDIKCFMFSTTPEIRSISEKMIKLGYRGHSRGSFGWTMREMQYIVRNGEEEYKKYYL